MSLTMSGPWTTNRPGPGLITLLGRETDDKFLSHVLDQINDRQAVAQVTDAFRMVYTPFHGTGYQQIPYVLEQLGIRVPALRAGTDGH